MASEENLSMVVYRGLEREEANWLMQVVDRKWVNTQDEIVKSEIRLL